MKNIGIRGNISIETNRFSKHEIEFRHHAQIDAIDFGMLEAVKIEK